jgi:hypothetical protein
MPGTIDALSNADLFRIMGPMTLTDDPTGAAASVAINGQTVISSKGQVTPGPQPSGTVQTLAAAGTIVPTNVASVRVTAASLVTGIIISPGTVAGQTLTVIHEGALVNMLIFAASGTSNVAGGINQVQFGLSAVTYIWDAITALWYALSPLQAAALYAGAKSATSVAIAGSGTITTTNLGVSRLAPAGAITGVIMQPGTFDGQCCIVVITTAAANTITMAAAGTSNVAGGTTVVLAGLEAHFFVWESVTALWYVAGPVAN